MCTVLMSIRYSHWTLLSRDSYAESHLDQYLRGSSTPAMTSRCRISAALCCSGRSVGSGRQVLTDFDRTGVRLPRYGPSVRSLTPHPRGMSIRRRRFIRIRLRVMHSILDWRNLVTFKRDCRFRRRSLHLSRNDTTNTPP